MMQIRFFLWKCIFYNLSNECSSADTDDECKLDIDALSFNILSQTKRMSSQYWYRRIKLGANMN